MNIQKHLENENSIGYWKSQMSNIGICEEALNIQQFVYTVHDINIGLFC